MNQPDPKRWIGVVILVFFFAILTKGPTTEYSASEDGITVIHKDWWGIRRHESPLRYTESGAEIKVDGKWIPYRFYDE